VWSIVGVVEMVVCGLLQVLLRGFACDLLQVLLRWLCVVYCGCC